METDISRRADEPVTSRPEGTLPGNIGVALLEAARSTGGVESLPLPERTDRARAVDFRRATLTTG